MFILKTTHDALHFYTVNVILQIKIIVIIGLHDHITNIPLKYVLLVIITECALVIFDK